MEKDKLTLYYKEHYGKMFFYAFSLTKNREDAEDLVASAFIKAMLSYEEGNFTGWMYIVIRNEYINHYNKFKNIVSDQEEFTEPVSDEDILEEYILNEKKRWIYNEIFKLPFKERQIMILSSAGELSDFEISEVVNVTVDNVRVMRHRTRQKLQKKYEEVWR